MPCERQELSRFVERKRKPVSRKMKRGCLIRERNATTVHGKTGSMLLSHGRKSLYWVRNPVASWRH